MRVYRIFAALLTTIAALSGASLAYADGNVTAEVVDGELVVNGDSKPNRIEILHVGEGAFTIAGTDQNTTINGEKSFKAGKIRRINAMLSGGNDELEISSVAQENGLSLAEHLFVDMGPGDDDLEIVDFWVGGHSILFTDESQENGGVGFDDDKGGTDDDYIYMEQLFVNNLLVIYTGRGEDTILGKSVNDFNVNTALAGAYINTGTESKSGDQVHLSGLFSWGEIEIETSQGDDQVILETVLVYNGDLEVKTHDGGDTVEIAYYDGWNMNWQLNDYDTSLIVELGDGPNELTITGLKIKGNVFIEGGNQTDDVVLRYVEAKLKIVATLFNGDDTMVVDGCEAAYGYLHGGKHKDGDTLLLLANFFEELDKIDWEN